MQTLQDLNQQVVELYTEGRFNEAIEIAKQALILAKSLHSGDHTYVASSLNNLGLLYKSQGRFSEAEPLYKQALQMYQRLFEGDHTDLAQSLNNLGLLYESQGRYYVATPIYKRLSSCGTQSP